MQHHRPSSITVGLALFSMFFGSGNLIFPLTLGRDAGSAFWISSLGFILSAVLIPALGVFAITLAEGNYDTIFQSLFRGRIATLLIFVVLLSFIPFGAGPRCVVLAHASLKTFVPMPSLMVFSVAFLGLVGYLVMDKRHLITVLGKVLTPILLLCIAIMVVFAIMNGEIDEPRLSHTELFTKSLFEGYLTQDLLSALFFSSSLIVIMKPVYQNKRELIVTMFKGATLGIGILTVLYVCLIAAASFHSTVLAGHSGIDLVSILAQSTMGPNLGFVAALAVALACLTTAVALAFAFSEFLKTHFLKNNHAAVALPITLTSMLLTASLEFDGIMAIITPLMKFIYPLVVLVVVVYLYDLRRKKAAH